MPPTSSCPDCSRSQAGDTMTLVDLDGLLACLEFEDLGEGRWTAPHLQMDYRRIFGGQLLAQAVVLADASAPAKAGGPLSWGFPREGGPDEPPESRPQGGHARPAFPPPRRPGPRPPWWSAFPFPAAGPTAPAWLATSAIRSCPIGRIRSATRSALSCCTDSLPRNHQKNIATATATRANRTGPDQDGRVLKPKSSSVVCFATERFFFSTKRRNRRSTR